ncbi:efflux RND transporter permease subunit [Desulfuromonas acetoxidans]|uniref:Acriflavin resistance protein n=1 Tax=Desulfuromonas acetoxidans (strain DSM 684 / 11070) TaxID=281689 RepID=Q1JVZ4_DESA6|nr:efflux RND transporter permease subunit [Desulfuromonas acetoxidans]EAT14411.1 acriflavin resistance protein [Desulfuromonas acetoxidans DSM 684]MBF0646555.1 efflux RND transporter permease subunit [Desulfuromonas acetoxidans]NVD25688.1 efflux RND transporter permease subunit [Desulfuromonas acetoxidans]NVE16984.1 efflux RND transporter permease subunit [Desulfuromonas acetoxidans]
MSVLHYSIKKPVSVAVFVIMILMFGIIGLNKLPVQLTPDVELPEITVTTTWPGATPYDIEQEIIEDQEDALKGLQNLISLESSSYNNYGTISLVFKVGVDIDNALLRVANKLDEVGDYPENVDKPIIEAAGANSSPVIWLLLKTKQGNETPIDQYRTFYDNEVEQHLERIDGVGSLFVGGGTEKELQVVVDREKMARHNITISQVTHSLQQANENTSAGNLSIGKKDYRIRTVSRFQNETDPLDVVLVDDGIKRVYLRDVATTQEGFEKRTFAVQNNGKPCIVVGIRKEKGANVIDLVQRAHETIDELNAGLLADNGLTFDWVYDQTPYINTAISIVKQNALIGGLLAIVVLLVFLRSVSGTAITAIAIPVSVIGTFISLWVFHRNLNVVSLAGISFAIGMLVDSAIVVLENIDRHRQMGKKAFDAALDGASEVFGAVLASTATTVAVFLPVIFIEQEAGQLFRDIAIAITFAILLSMIVSLVVIPCLANLVYGRRPVIKQKTDRIGRFGQRFVDGIMRFSDLSLKSVATRIMTVTLLTLTAALLVWILLPKSEYLPQGNRNLIMNILIPPPGLSVEKRESIGQYVYKQVEPYVKEDWKDGIPQIKTTFFVATPDLNIMGSLSTHETEARGMMPLMTRVMNSIPDMIGVSLQAGIFESNIGEGRAVEVNITGTELPTLVNAGRTLYGAISQAIPQSQIRPVPSLEISYPEVSIVPDKKKLVANGLTETELGEYVDVLMDGRQIGDYMPDGTRKVDLVVKASDAEVRSPEDILNSTIVNRYGELIRVGDIARAEYEQGMTQIDHYERRRNITLQVTPSADIPLQQATETIEGLVAQLRKGGKLDGTQIFIGGNADKLVETREALQWNLLLALVITYLLMAVLFENFFYPLIIMFSVPLAAAGGFIGLKAVNLFVAPQGFDILTMLGFIILIGTVVNNAILIVHQSLNNVRFEGMKGIDAIRESVRTRIRPIFMSTTTSLFGLLPLVLSTGAGSELYRGIGSVLLGGLLVSTVFTLFVIPALLAFFIHRERAENAE